MNKRTDNQNRAIHLYLELLARQLNENGHTLQDVVERIRKAEIIATKENLKEVVWKPMQKALYGLESTKDLDRVQPDRIHEMIEAWKTREFRLDYIPFPSDEELRNERDYSLINKDL